MSLDSYMSSVLKFLEGSDAFVLYLENRDIPRRYPETLRILRPTGTPTLSAPCCYRYIQYNNNKCNYYV